MKQCLLSEEVQEEIGRGLGLIKDTAAAREVRCLLLNYCMNNLERVSLALCSVFMLYIDYLNSSVYMMWFWFLVRA